MGKFRNIVIISMLIIWSGQLETAENQPVDFSDLKLKEIIERQLHIKDPTPADMEKLTQLDLNPYTVKNLTGLEYAVNLRTIRGGSILNDIKDISVLYNLPKLVTLSLSPGPNGLERISRITQVKNLTLNLVSFKSKDISKLSLLNDVENLTIIVHDQARNLPAFSEIIPNPQLTVKLLGYFEDLSFLVGLKNLKGLDLGDARIEDRSILFQLVGLREFTLSVDDIEEITTLSKIKTLQRLSLDARNIGDFSVLNYLEELEQLKQFRIFAPSLEFKEITFLLNLNQLTSLELEVDLIEDISALSNLPKLESLNLSGCKISDISALSKLTKLKTLNLRHNKITNIFSLSELSQLETLNLSENEISDISVLSNLHNLTTLEVSENKINDISALSGLTQLETLNLSKNSINDISIVYGLKKLVVLDARENNISEVDVSALARLTNLYKLFFYDNNITDVSTAYELYDLLESHGNLDRRLKTDYLSKYMYGNPTTWYMLLNQYAMETSKGINDRKGKSVKELTEEIVSSIATIWAVYPGFEGIIFDANPPLYTYTYEWGDCPAGCIYERTWQFKVQDSQMELVKVEGDDPHNSSSEFRLDPNLIP